MTVSYTEEAKARFRNLRTYFFREDHKVTASKPSEASSTCGGPQYRSQWEFFEDLTFLRSCHHPRGRTASTGSGSVDDSSDETDLATANDESSSTDDANASGGSGVQGVVCVGGDDDAAKVSAALPQEPPTKKRRTQLEAAEDFGREEREPTSSALCWHESTTNDGSKDENYHFAMMIAQELRHMEPIKRDMLKLKLFETMPQAKHNVMLERSVSSALNSHCSRN
ncbi:hypothetical protein HPB50_005864 [Hyalomma asiaticum]|uniref:Uncharacterized protein n=1 Tax=Hyalomma asiaticum TaxID=266040 RepID=A0ACB7S3Q2_HYAAI|nr:hypothetical protein HPB50_005864 [Hyalomma asiaticum]